MKWYAYTVYALVQGGGFEPPKAKPADLQSALVDRLSNPARVEPSRGFEPRTPSLPWMCSTPELRWRNN